MDKVPSEINQIIKELSTLVKTKYPDLNIEVKISMKNKNITPKEKPVKK